MSQPSRQVVLVTDLAQHLPQILKDAQRRDLLAIDTETTGLDMYAADFDLVSVVLVAMDTDGSGTAYYLPTGHISYPGIEPYQPANLDRAAVRDLLREIVRLRGDRRVKFHNAVYDLLVLSRTLGIEVDELPADDVYVLANLVNENFPKSLKELSRIYLGIQETKPVLPADVQDELANRLLVWPDDARLRDDWVEVYTCYFRQFHHGAVSFKFVTSLFAQMFAMLKKNKVVSYKGTFPTNFAYIPLPVACLYAGDDVWNTASLWASFTGIQLACEPQIMNLYNTIEQPVLQIMTRASERGVAFDAEHLRHTKTLLSRRIMEYEVTADKAINEILDKRLRHAITNPDALAMCAERANIEKIMSSNKVLATFLFDVCGFTPVKTTATGNPSTDSDSLQQLAGATPRYSELTDAARTFIDCRLKIGKLAKIQSTYTTSLLDKASNGRIHPKFNTVGTVSGRMSSHDPNIQNIPRLTPEEQEASPWLLGVDIRKAFVADPGYVFVNFDWDNMEMVGVAGLSGDTTLKQLLVEGRDLHAYLARHAFDVGHDLTDKEFKKKYPLLRQDAKPVGFALVYGGTAYTLQQRLKCDRDKAEALEATYFRIFPGVKRWIDGVYERLKKQGYTDYPIYGYRKRMDLPDEELMWADPHTYERQYRAALRTCQNAEIQGLCAMIVKNTIVDIERELRKAGLSPQDAQIVLQVHDEINVLVKYEYAELVQEICNRCSNREVLGVKFTASAEFKRTMSKADEGYTLDEIRTLAARTGLAVNGGRAA